MSQPGTFERVYAVLKEQLRKGAFGPGERLEPAAFCDRLNASVTPIRDALHRLTGERLIEAPRNEGFRMPMLTETTLRHLYAWHRDLLLLAAAKHAAVEALEEAGGEAASPVHERRNAVFAALAQSSGNPEHVHALDAVMARLEPIQQLEESFLDGMDAEIAQICEAVRSNDRSALRKSLVRYHRRRERIVPDLLSRLHNGALKSRSERRR
jgi:DNA-binding GntR family transcriptional regulator